MAQKEIKPSRAEKEPRHRLKGWAALFLGVFFLWAFMFHIGPRIEDSVPPIKEMTEVVRERDIDTTAFFYSENKESYQAERYLRESLDSSRPKGYGLDGFFVLGIVCCLVILIFGFWSLPVESDPESKDRD